MVYAYDPGGNLTSRTEYPYTTGELGEPTAVIPYTYDEVWKDKLTGYGNQSLTYDEIGNPLSYRDGMTLTWNGRQLESLTDEELSVSYRYGADGLRTGKTVNGEEVEYWYEDGRLLYEKRGTDKEFYYSYDGYGNLSCIRYFLNGAQYTYYFLTNARGDEIGRAHV